MCGLHPMSLGALFPTPTKDHGNSPGKRSSRTPVGTAPLTEKARDARGRGPGENAARESWNPGAPPPGPVSFHVPSALLRLRLMSRPPRRERVARCFR